MKTILYTQLNREGLIYAIFQEFKYFFENCLILRTAVLRKNKIKQFFIPKIILKKFNLVQAQGN